MPFWERIKKKKNPASKREEAEELLPLITPELDLSLPSLPELKGPTPALPADSSGRAPLTDSFAQTPRLSSPESMPELSEHDSGMKSVKELEHSKEELQASQYSQLRGAVPPQAHSSSSGDRERFVPYRPENRDSSYEPPATMTIPRPGETEGDAFSPQKHTMFVDPMSEQFGSEISGVGSMPLGSRGRYLSDERSFFRSSLELNLPPAIDERGVEPLLIPSLLEIASQYRQWVERFARSHEAHEVSQMWIAYLELCPEDLESLLAYGWHLFDQQGPEVAWPIFEHALGQAPEHSSYFETAGRFWMRAHQPLRAISYFEEALRLSPHNRELLFYLRDAQRRAGQEEAALITEGRISTLERGEERL